MYKKIQIIGVGAIIINKKKEILLTQRREPVLKMWDKKWGIPGGHLEFGESPEKRLRKEMREELNIRIKIVQHTPFVVSKTLNLGIVRFHGLFLGYLCTIISGIPKISNNENYDFQWIKPKSINYKKCIPTTSEFIHQLIRLKWHFK
jgi:8-oxo-dGTP diphosphatase